MSTETPKAVPFLSDDDVQWIVNDNSELGVKIGDQFFFMYKGGSLQYEEGLHDDGTPMMWREIGKREFGECCHPVKIVTGELRLGGARYTEPLLTWKKDMDGLEALPNGGWKQLPPIPQPIPPAFRTTEEAELQRLRGLLEEGERLLSDMCFWHDGSRTPKAKRRRVEVKQEARTFLSKLKK